MKRSAALLLGLAACANPPPDDPEATPEPRERVPESKEPARAIYGPPPTVGGPKRRPPPAPDRGPIVEPDLADPTDPDAKPKPLPKGEDAAEGGQP